MTVVAALGLPVDIEPVNHINEIARLGGGHHAGFADQRRAQGRGARPQSAEAETIMADGRA